MILLALLGITYYHMYVLLLACLLAIYLVQKEDQKAEVFSWAGYCLVLIATIGAALLGVGCEKASTKAAPPPATMVPTSGALASINDSQLTVTVEVPKGGRVGEVVVTFEEDVSDALIADGCAGWYRLEDMWGLTWGVLVRGTQVVISPAVRTDDLVEGTWVVHVRWLRGVQLPKLAKVEVK